MLEERVQNAEGGPLETQKNLGHQKWDFWHFKVKLACYNVSFIFNLAGLVP